MRPGDWLVLFTDGITDANSPSGEFFGRERLRETIASSGAKGSQALCDHVLGAVTRFQADAAQMDDMALLVVGVDGISARGGGSGIG